MGKLIPGAMEAKKVNNAEWLIEIITWITLALICLTV
jgi:hypothetical protein